MSNKIKIGSSDITIKLGSADVDAIYLGNTLVYSGGTPPTPSYKWLATYSDSHTESAECDPYWEVIGDGEIELTDLVSVEIGDCVTTLDYNVFFGCDSLTSVTIPNSVTEIGDMVFYNCTNLTGITIPDSVTTIGGNAFEGCSSLTNIDIPSGVTSIGNEAFYECRSLTEITIPDNVTSIGDSAFEKCYSLTSITINATTPPIGISDTTFRATNDCPIYVPSGSVNAYKSASGWSEYASRIQAIPFYYQVQYGDSLSGMYAKGMRVSTAVTLSGTHNVTFGDISSNTYTLLYENGNWYNWRIMTNGAFTPDSKTLLTASGGYYTITFDTVYSCLGADGDEYGQGTVWYAPFDFEIIN